uniref:DNA helicase Pif1-like 2B domain-containing protein n=1 Tax=Anopheles atroparvus TaxID=41427 RepID=A0AAG5DRF0_ANOAO
MILLADLRSYKSIDRVENDDDAVNYPVEFLNSLDLPDMPPHHLRLKVGSVIIMLRNLHAPKLCNGTRLIITQLSNNVIVARILKGTYKGAECLIPRIPLGSNDMPFHFKRIQFPVKLAFAMTINKSQGQSLEVCGINLEMPCFSHGQLYVACSRVGKPTSLYIYAPEKKTKKCSLSSCIALKTVILSPFMTCWPDELPLRPIFMIACNRFFEVYNLNGKDFIAAFNAMQLDKLHLSFSVLVRKCTEKPVFQCHI